MEIKKEENQKLNIYIAVKTCSIDGETKIFLSNLHVKVTGYSFSKLCASKQQLRVWEISVSLLRCVQGKTNNGQSLDHLNLTSSKNSL